MRAKGVSFRHAVELLRADHSSLAAGEARVVKKGTTAKLDAPVKAEADDQEALRQVVAFYHETLKESPEALRYLESTPTLPPPADTPVTTSDLTPIAVFSSRHRHPFYLLRCRS